MRDRSDLDDVDPATVTMSCLETGSINVLYYSSTFPCI